MESNWSCDPSLSGYRYFGASLGLAVTAVGGAGNLLTLLAFAADARLRTPFNLLILNLTLSDLLYCAFLQPVTAASYLRMGWRGGRRACRAFGLLLFTSNATSILSLGLIAGARYALVRGAGRWRGAHSRCPRGVLVPVLLAGTWLLSLSLFAPLWPVFEFQPAVCTCSFNRETGRPYTSILMVLLFGVGLSSIGVFYCLLAKRVSAARRALDAHRQRRMAPGEIERSTASWQSEGASAPPPAQPRAGSDSHRVTRMCVASFCVFVACYLPFCLLNVLDRGSRAPVMVHAIVASLTWLNGCVNPFLYAFMNRQFSQAYRRLFHKVWARCVRWSPNIVGHRAVDQSASRQILSSSGPAETTQTTLPPSQQPSHCSPQ
ncbi:G-protein coupled receptor 84-like [Hemiscyllium ocellatum]|uniref:G-protein coupled receptor 84-like n=1 Tax=Hemiscyllium ocellatum TaxID=170820 RepID=UPI0029669FAE|nr:G-protein coupled receptor 84-like [Hemiscyllium ocellatum]XP_060678359.1 G-protein coupled receptor 84-like [Hemiscyllium ocellatum]